MSHFVLEQKTLICSMFLLSGGLDRHLIQHTHKHARTYIHTHTHRGIVFFPFLLSIHQQHNAVYLRTVQSIAPKGGKQLWCMQLRFSGTHHIYRNDNKLHTLRTNVALLIKQYESVLHDEQLTLVSLHADT